MIQINDKYIKNSVTAEKLEQSIRKLIEAVGEEIMDVAIDQKDECPIVDDVLRQQRLKLKEIISSLDK